MKISILSADIGNLDSPKPGIMKQVLPINWELDYKYINETVLPLRPVSLSPRMQSKIPKMLGFEYTDADFIIWLDSAYTIKTDNFVKWMLDHLNYLNGGKICLMPHDQRKSIKSELDFVMMLMLRKDPYILNRYFNEPMINQVNTYLNDKTFNDTWLAAAGCFIYHNTLEMQLVMKDWLLECVKWSCQDQFSLPYVLNKHKIIPRWLDHSVWDCPHLQYTAHKKIA